LAPPRAQPSFVDRAQVLFDATLVVDPAGVIRVFLLPDTAHFDPWFRGVRAELDREIAASPASAPSGRPPRTDASELLPPDQVVALSADVRPSEGPEGGQIAVRLAIAPGYHVMSDRPSDPFSIATTVRASGDGLAFGAAEYPAAKSVGALSVFDGTPEVHIPIHRVAGRAAVSRSIAVDVRYQACTDSRCLPPVRKRVEVPAP
jgi:hypothetical protein